MANYQQLSTAQKIQLVEDIWDSIALDCADLPVTETQRAELDRRLDRAQLDGFDDIDARSYIEELKSRL